MKEAVPETKLRQGRKLKLRSDGVQFVPETRLVLGGGQRASGGEHSDSRDTLSLSTSASGLRVFVDQRTHLVGDSHSVGEQIPDHACRSKVVVASNAPG